MVIHVHKTSNYDDGELLKKEKTKSTSDKFIISKIKIITIIYIKLFINITNLIFY